MESKDTAYIALVRSVLEYGCIIWDPYSQQDILSLEKVQRRAARFIIQDYKTRTPGFMTNALQDIGLPTLQDRRQYNRLIFFYKTINGFSPAVDINNYTTPIQNKRQIKTRKFPGYETNNPIDKCTRNNSLVYSIKIHILQKPFAIGTRWIAMLSQQNR